MRHTILKTSQTKDFRKELTRTMFLILAMCVGQITVAFLGSLIGLADHKEFFGTVYLLYCAVAIFVIYKKGKDYVFDNETEKEKMTPVAFIRHFSVMIAMMLFATIPTVVVDMILQPFGLTLMSIGAANTFSDSITEFFYVSLIGPICEEVIFRGLIQKRMEKYSPVIAIAVSAVAFGVYHGNFGQMFPMIGVGVALGYVAYKYSMKWSIIIHVIYNTVFGELFGILTKALEKDGEEYLLPIINQPPFMVCILVLSFIGIAFIAYQLLVKKTAPFSDYKIKLSKLMMLFTSSGMLTFIMYNLICAILLLEKI